LEAIFQVKLQEVQDLLPEVSVARCQLLPPFVETFTFNTFVPMPLAVPVMVYVVTPPIRAPARGEVIVDIGGAAQCSLPPSSAYAGGDRVSRQSANPVAHTALRSRKICFSGKKAGRHEVKFIIILLIKPQIICRVAVHGFSIASENKEQCPCRTMAAVRACPTAAGAGGGKNCWPYS
jgi:hypothetical protein